MTNTKQYISVNKRNNPRNATGKNFGKTVSKVDRYYKEENRRVNVNEYGMRFKLGPILYERGYTVKEFAKKIDVREGTLLDFIKGKSKRIPVDLLAKVCAELECGIHDLIDFPTFK